MSILRARQAWKLMLIGACLLLLLSLPRSAVAQTPAPALSVHRTPGAESCPDAAWLERTVSSVVGQQLASAGDSVEVRFSYSDGTYSAVISYSSSPGEQSRREIRDVSDDCADLGHATATALTILFELKAETAQKQPEIAPPPATEPARAEPANEAVVSASERPPRLSLAASVGAAFAYGLVDGASFGALFEGTFAREWFGVHAGVLWLPDARHEVPPGAIETELFSLSLRGCWRAWRGSFATLGACTGFFAGALDAEANGFTTNTDTQRPWLAIPLGLEMERSHAAGAGLGFDWRLTALGVVPLRRESLAVSGLGTVLEPTRVGLLVQLAVGPRWLF